MLAYAGAVEGRELLGSGTAVSTSAPPQTNSFIFLVDR